MKQSRLFELIPVAILGVAATFPNAYAAPRDLPLLPPGKHLGMIVGFEKLPPELQMKADGYWKDAVAKGMDVGRVQSDWGVLEPKPGEYNKPVLEHALQDMKAKGMHPFVTITTLDTEGYSMPPFLMDEKGEHLKDSLNVGSPSIVEGFKKLLDWVVPLCKQYGVWALSIANEPETMFKDHPEEADGLVRFLRASREYAHGLCPDLAVTVTLGSSGVFDQKPWIAPLVSESDVACFNYYGIDHLTLEVYDDFSRVQTYMSELVKAADGRYVMLQEWGCPAGYTDKPSPMKTSPEKQRDFFKASVDMMAKDPQIRVAFAFQLLDWSPQLTKQFSEGFLKAGTPELVARQLEEWLLTSGLVRYEDGAPRPAWDVFLQGVARFPK
jgi:hypothetical protein